VLFKVIAALIAIIAFPFTAALMNRLLPSIDGMTPARRPNVSRSPHSPIR
jgi:hypothetical protein